MKRLSWKYIAGLVDGEGCIDFQLIKKPYDRQDGTRSVETYILPRLRVAMTGEALPLLEILHANHGGSLVARKKPQNPAWSQSYSWELTNGKVRPVLQNIVNHLLVKREQARFCIWVLDNLRGKQSKQKGYENLSAARTCARDELKAMKRDPQRLSERAVSEVMNIIHGS